MKWSDFVAAVLVDLPVDNERIGIATGNPNYLSQQLLYAIIQIQQLIEFYQSGHETVYGPNDLVLEGMASVGSLPATDQCRPLDAYFKKTGEQCASRPLQQYPWGNRLDLVCGNPSLANGRGFIAIDPFGRQFTAYPLVQENQQISLRWEGVKTSFADADETPFDMDVVETVGLFVKAKIARMVDHDLAEHQSYMGEYRQRRTLLYADSLDRARLKLNAPSGEVQSGCANSLNVCGSAQAATSLLRYGNNEDTTEFCAFGDSSNISTEADTLAVSVLVKTLEPDFVLHLGDCNYPAGDPVTIQANLLAYYGLYIPKNFFLAMGNHDIETDGGAALIALLARQAALNEGKTYFSYSPSPNFARIYVLDTNAADPAEQAAWLQAEMLASSTWNIVAMHKSPYTSDVNHAPGDVTWRLPFKTWGAHLVISAHGHNYERLLIDGLLYIVCGLGGAPKRGFVNPAVTGSQYRYNATNGTTYVTARRDRLQVALYSTTGDVIDSVAVETEQVFA